jgi:transcriptional regulator with XRE-family HTH domain
MPEDIYEVLASRLRDQRKKAGLSIEKLAELAGVGAGFLAHIETNQKKPSVATLGKIASALQISIADLFARHALAQPNEDQRLALQLTHLLHGKNRQQQKAIVAALRTLSKNLK